MLILLSPAKNLNAKLNLDNFASLDFSQPQFKDEVKQLVEYMQDFAPQDLANIQKTNDSISELNFTRWQSWQNHYDLQTALPAAFAFAGPVFQNLNALDMKLDNLQKAQEKLRILSGLYGVLRPLDLMQNYRLEMGTKLEPTGFADKNLYNFWDEKISDNLMQELQSHKNKFVLNLASKEYFKATKSLKKRTQVINVEFKQELPDKFKTIVIYTKMARGKMAKFIIENNLENLADIKAFNVDGYKFHPALSDELNWTFTRLAD